MASLGKGSHTVIKNKNKRIEGIAQGVKSMWQALGSILSTVKKDRNEGREKTVPNARYSKIMHDIIHTDMLFNPR
jgi:hypothetical protein